MQVEAEQVSFLDMLTDQEREIVEKTPLEVRAALEHEMKILKFREHKILEKIAEYEKAEEGAVYLSAMTEIRGKNNTTMRFSDRDRKSTRLNSSH